MKKIGVFSYRVKLILIWCVVILLATGMVSLGLTYNATRQMLEDQKAHLELLTEQVLINLIENAYKYGRSAQPIEVTICAEGCFVRFIVRDRGPGISPELLPVIFEGFLGRDGQSADSSRGLGIGLSICRSIITAHGGTIQAENRPGGGAQFTFTLPLEEEETDARA